MEAQPVELDLKRSQIAENEAQAAQHRMAALGAQQRLRDQQLLRQVDEEARAEERAVREAEAQGRDLTVADRPPEGFAKKRSAAAPLERMLNYADRAGVPTDLIVPLAEKVAKIKGDEALQEQRETQASINRIKASQERAERVGALAQHALKGPREFALAKLQAAQDGLPLDFLPANYAEAVPMLRQMVDAAVTVKEKADLAIKKQTADAATSRAGAAHVSAAAASRRADAYVQTQTVRRDILNKAAGPGSEDAADAKRATTEARRTAAFRQQLIFAPQIPLKLEEKHEGKLFTGTDRNIYRFDGFGPPSAKFPKGTPLLLPMSREAVIARQPGFKAAMEEEDD